VRGIKDTFKGDEVEGNVDGAVRPMKEVTRRT
jgi:hypothetical protein